MLFPKKVKYRRFQRMRSTPGKRHAGRGIAINFGSYGMQAMSQKRIRSGQIEAARKVIARTLGKTGRVWIRIFPDRPWTQKAAETGMGKGKGDPQGFEVEVLPGRILFEVSGISEDIARNAVIKAGKKLPLKVKFVVKDQFS
ncbi:MAG: 50S ribosomal protein L16 [Candidatus Kaiserbacteria bacterium]|nr:50S ribosomal protein L16 [Candidatus Kaiserbacteria bacterium]